MKWIALICVVAFCVCSCKQHPAKVGKTLPAIDTSYLHNIYSIKGTTYIRSPEGLIRLPIHIDFYHEVTSNSIYQVQGNTVIKKAVLKLNCYIYFTTWDTTTMGLGGGHYNIRVYDTITRHLVKYDDDKFPGYVLNSDGKFIIDTKTNRLFSTRNSFNSNADVYTTAGMWSIEGDHFKFYKVVFDKDIFLEKGSDDADGSLVVKYYYHNLINNAQHGKLLPKGW